jgi:prolyl-tRNA synthetase
VSGANEEGFHFLNVNFGRDYQADMIVDIVSAEDGFGCPKCGSALRTVRGVEVGNIFKLGTRYSDAMGCSFLDKDGKEKSVIMGSYGIGSGRLLACIAEEHNDENGLIWPISVSPYHVHLVSLSSKDGGAVERAAEQAYQELQTARVEVLFDDREESPGVKFNDADLIGIPIRITASERAWQSGGYEFKLRHSREKEIIPQGSLVSRVTQEIGRLQSEIKNKVTQVPYED